MGLPGRESAHRAIEAVARQSYGRLIALLAARTRDVAGAEDALADALIAALAAWPRDGIPQNPQGWLLTAARNRLRDQARHRLVAERSSVELEIMIGGLHEEADLDALPDERLKLLFVCAHPAIDADMHTPLMLQAVLGLDAAAIGRAFLVSPAAMSQRLVRAKTKIHRTRIAFEIPATEIPRRMAAVLDAIYAAYGSSWEDAAGANPRMTDLASEAIWLARVLCDQVPDDAEAHGLLALMLHCEARRPARRSAEGRFVPLSEQDPRKWLRPLIEEAEEELVRSARQGRPGRYQLEAAIQSVHAERASSGRTEWDVIAAFYDRLVRMAPALGAAVARAAAHAEAHGPEAGLALLDEIDARRISSYQPYWVVRAHLLKRMKRAQDANEAFDCAIGLSEDAAVRAFLLERRSL